MTGTQRTLKRCFDIVASASGLVVAGPIILLATIAARWDTRASGIFRQTRVGLDGKTFQILKIRTMREGTEISTTVTTSHDRRITRLGRLLRKTKVDELPQLWNVLKGEMSFVGPRPDVPKQLADLSDEDRRDYVSIRPGITGVGSLKYRNEEEILARQQDPERYNREIIFPDKVRLNREYIENYSLLGDLGYLWKTLFGDRNASVEVSGILPGPESVKLDRLDAVEPEQTHYRRSA
ncbi:MAG: sugar transferase [Planctomycetaceae bacterium]